MISFVTDLEGQWDKLVTFASANPYVSLVDDELVLADEASFVFGGDAIDRGPAGQKLVRTLTAAKRRYGERVVLLAGNRDINKLRLVREIDAPRPGATGGSTAERLRWTFEHTMGAPHAFEFRAQELGTSDPDAVVASFRADVAGDGELRTYLELAQLAHRSGTTLFVHGGISAANLFTTPGAPRAASVDAWVSALNTFYRAQLASADPEALIAYQAPLPGTHANETSVVYARPTDDLGDPILPGPEVIAALRANGISRIVVGHTPSGDCPAVIRSGDFELVLADNSYGRIEHGSQLAITDEAIAVRGWTKLDDGATEIVDLAARRDSGGPLGTHDPEGLLIKSRLRDGRYLRFRSLGDHRVQQIAR